MNSSATAEEIENVIKEIKGLRLKPDISQGKKRTVIGVIGDERKIDFPHLAALPGVKEARMIETPYKLISREYGRRTGELAPRRVIKVGNIKIGGDEPVFIAGPCALESKEQIFTIAEGAKKAGAHILRGGIFKPRTSVYSFQGLGSTDAGAREALSWLKEAGDKYGMPVITEARGESQVELIAEYVDIIQIGARNMYDQDLLGAVGRTGKPVLFKRHFGAGIEEFLSFAEYIAVEGNRDIILCERGAIPIGKGRSYTRYTLDLQAVPVLEQETYLPVMVDPSHAAGRRDIIHNMSCASIAAGACALMIEVHHNPAEAWVDGAHSITPDELKGIIDSCRRIHEQLH
jgi:3-deoxy-7-phosphoheptulonate synthase